MARKAKRRAARRPPRPAAAQMPTASAGAASRTGTATRVGGDQALVRSVEMSLGPRAPVKRAGRVVLESGDPAIPIDRVPYFTKDLMRLGVVAGAMVVLLVAGAQLIPFVVK